MTFRVIGIAQPKGSARAFVPKGWTRAVVTTTNPKIKGWQQLVAEAASRTMDAQRIEKIAEGPIYLKVDFFLKRPKAIRAKQLPHLTKPDLDKLLRGICDALTGVAWGDDAQVVQIDAVKAYTNHPTTAPSAIVTVEPWKDDKELV